MVTGYLKKRIENTILKRVGRGTRKKSEKKVRRKIPPSSASLRPDLPRFARTRQNPPCWWPSRRVIYWDINLKRWFWYKHMEFDGEFCTNPAANLPSVERKKTSPPLIRYRMFRQFHLGWWTKKSLTVGDPCGGSGAVCLKVFNADYPCTCGECIPLYAYHMCLFAICTQQHRQK